MEMRHKVLLVDDDPTLLELYSELLAQLPSRPEIHTATSGSRAMAMLAAEPFRLLICDLKMPKVDGLQVLSTVRRKYPQLRTVAMTSLLDEQFRSRVYALGVDLFWHKPATEQETQMFLECLESLLGQETDSGFRGLQSKSLMDIIQLECISQSSLVLRITNGPLTGRVWIQNGEVIDAEADELRSEAAFRKILSWRAGSFETLSPEPNRPRAIFQSYNSLLLDSAQAIDESLSQAQTSGVAGGDGLIAQAAKVEGVEFALALKAGQTGPPLARGLENPELLATWTRKNLERFDGLGERLHAGPLEQIEGLGPQRHLVLGSQAEALLCFGWKPSMGLQQIRENMKKVFALWAS
jgi:CheY-like chemotaxis protein